MAMLLEPGAPTPPGTIPLCVPWIQGNEWRYVKECLDTNFVSSVGPFVDRFEAELAAYLGAGHAAAAASGTAALHVALHVAGVRANDEVLLSDLTFIAPANAIRYVGAWPVFIDAGKDYWQMDPEKVLGFLVDECVQENGALRNKATGRRVSAIMPVHILGHPVDMDPIVGAARTYGLAVIEDATEGLGAEYKGRKVGTLGDIACFSFNGNKIITTGGGGMIVTDRGDWARKAKYLTTQAKDDPIEFVHQEIGYNYRMTNVLAAIGCAQLEQIGSCIQAKRDIAQRYRDALSAVPGVTCMREAPWAFSTHWLFTALIDAAVYGVDSRQLLRVLQDKGVQARPLWQPMHLSPAHRESQPRQCPVATDLNRDALSLPCSVGLEPQDQEKIIRVLSEVGSGNPGDGSGK